MELDIGIIVPGQRYDNVTVTRRLERDTSKVSRDTNNGDNGNDKIS